MDKNGITRSIIIYHYTNEITVNIKIMDIFYYFYIIISELLNREKNN